MNKKVILSARESMQENLRVLLDGLPADAIDRACQIIVDGLAPVLAADKERRAVVVTQIGTENFRMERTTNLLDIRVGKLLPRSEVEAMRAEGITVTVGRNK